MQKIIFITLVLFIAYSCNQASETQNQKDSLAINNDLPKAVKDTIDYIATEEDKAIYDSIVSILNKENSKEKPLVEIEMSVAKNLLGIPYVGGTLEKEGEEKLVVNLRGLDCATYLDNVVAITHCIKTGKYSFIDYCEMLAKIRYRNGEIDGYPSRLHYASDWFMDNEKKGFLKIVSNDFGNADFDPTVFFMSKNSKKYKKLANRSDFVKQIASYEKEISKAKLKFITKDKIEALASNIKDGDLIAFSTNVEGLDIYHVAIASFKDDELHFYHASSNKKKVILSEKRMSDYLSKRDKITGILVARLIE